MKQIPLICFIFLEQVSLSPAPQYQTSDLTANDQDVINDIFGDTIDDAYSESQTEKLKDVEIQVIRNEDGYVAPDDYQTPSDLTDKASTIVDKVFEKCEDYASQGYECVPYYQCHNGTIITDGGGLIDVRNGFGILSPEDSKCEGFLDVCCQDPDFVPPPVPELKFQPKCGRRHENGLGVRIQGFKEQESQFGEWPHMCAVLAEEAISQEVEGYSSGEPQIVNMYQCGGSLIAPGVILTAAHCVEKFRQSSDKLKVRCGEWDTQNQTEPRPHQDRYISDLDIHPEFNARSLANDWAVLYTDEPFDLEEHIDTICLPEPGEKFIDQTCFATGWGKDQFGSAGQYQVVLKEVDLQVVNHDECQDKLRNTRLGRKFKLDESFMCAGGDGQKDTCKGDGGSPLVCPSTSDPNTYVQAGIVAWGIGCGEANVPGVYASVSEGVCWVDYAMSCHFGTESGDFSSYWGYSAQQCQDWMDKAIVSLAERVDAMKGAENLKGRKRAEVLDAGVKAETVFEHYHECHVHWAPVEPQPFTNDEEDNTFDPSYPTESTQEASYSDLIPVDSYARQTVEVPETNSENSSGSLTDKGSY